MTRHPIRMLAQALILAASPMLVPVASAPAAAQSSPAIVEASWADLADLADTAELVVKAEIKKQAALDAERAVGVAPGYARLYIEAETVALIAGNVPLGESIRYLVDVPLDARGKVPKLRKSEVILFARPVPARPGEIQLVSRDAQLPWSPELEQRLRPILAALVAPEAPPRIAGIRDALSISGNLVGESETQIFLDTDNGKPLSISIVRRPGMAPVWGVSYSEIVDQAVRAPQPQSLGWYRLACFLPEQLPGAANISRDPADRARTDQDYRYVLQQLGPCPRTRTPPMS